MALLGLYVGVIPVSARACSGCPSCAGPRRRLVRFFMALTVGLLGFLAVDALVEGLQIGGTGPPAFGGPGARLPRGAGRRSSPSARSTPTCAAPRAPARAGYRLSLLIAIGIGLHNLGEGLAIGSAYAIGELALGAFLVVGFALHNTTEGLAVVAPIAHEQPALRRAWSASGSSPAARR